MLKIINLHNEVSLHIINQILPDGIGKVGFLIVYTDVHSLESGCNPM